MYFKRFLYISIFALTSCLTFSNPCSATNDNRIGLQNLHDRTIVYCHSNSQTSAEECASHYENQGYIRLKDIPRKTARYDFLTVDTYPSRRWRSGEVTPRW